MANGRVMPDTVLLPDGNVLVVGGGRFGKSGGLLAHFASVERGGEPDLGALDPVMEPELFDPDAETWRPLCRKPIGRLYHTSSLLLADGRVLVAGHDGALNMQPFDRSRYELEIFSPPYLYSSDGSLAPRPVIAAAPMAIDYGSQFEIRVEGSLRDGALIRPSAVTHQINTEQRYVGLALDRGGTDDTYVATAPPTGGVAPPGLVPAFHRRYRRHAVWPFGFSSDDARLVAASRCRSSACARGNARVEECRQRAGGPPATFHTSAARASGCGAMGAPRISSIVS